MGDPVRRLPDLPRRHEELSAIASHTRPLPVRYRDELEHWDGAARGELRVPRCTACKRCFWPPGPVCPRCMSWDVDWVTASGRGRIVTWVRFHKRYFEGDEVPYEVVQVELEEGPRLTTTFAGEDPEIGMPVQAVFRTVDDATLPEFAPRDAQR